MTPPEADDGADLRFGGMIAITHQDLVLESEKRGSKTKRCQVLEENEEGNRGKWDSMDPFLLAFFALSNERIFLEETQRERIEKDGGCVTIT